MRRLLSILLLAALFLMPLFTSCYPTVYDEDVNPTRPEDQQVPVDRGGNGETPAPAPEEGEDESSGG